MSNHEWTLTDTNQSRENHGFETRSFPRSLAATHRGFSFCLANPISSIHGYHGLGSARGSRACLKAWPSLRVRCSGGLAETISIHHGGTRTFLRSCFSFIKPYAGAIADVIVSSGTIAKCSGP